MHNGAVSTDMEKKTFFILNSDFSDVERFSISHMRLVSFFQIKSNISYDTIGENYRVLTRTQIYNPSNQGLLVIPGTLLSPATGHLCLYIMKRTVTSVSI